MVRKPRRGDSQGFDDPKQEKNITPFRPRLTSPDCPYHSPPEKMERSEWVSRHFDNRAHLGWPTPVQTLQVDLPDRLFQGKISCQSQSRLPTLPCGVRMSFLIEWLVRKPQTGKQTQQRFRKPAAPSRSRRPFLDVLEDRWLPAAPLGIVIVEPNPPQGLAGTQGVGTQLTVNGQNLSGNLTVDFVNVADASQSFPGTNVVVTIAGAQITVDQPDLDVGSYNVIVSNEDGSSTASQFTLYQVLSQVGPTVSSFSPSFGAVAGQTITVSGSSFTSTTSTTVQFVSTTNPNVSVPGTNVQVNSAGNSLTVERPTLDVGNYYIVVTTNAGSSNNTSEIYQAVTPAVVSATHFTDSVSDITTVTSLDVISTVDFPSSGSIFVETTGGVATFNYTGTTPTSFTGLTLVTDDPFGAGANAATGSLDTTYPAVYQASTSRYQIQFANQTNLRTAPDSNIYVAMYWSTAVSGSETTVFYYLNSPNSNGTGGAYAPASALGVGTNLPTYLVSNVSGQSLTLDVPYIPTNSARFVVGIGAPPQVTVVENSTGDIGISVPTPNTYNDYYDYFEFTLDANGADNTVPNGQRFFPTLNINTTQVDQFGIPITLSGLSNNNGVNEQTSVGVTLSPNVARDAIFQSFSSQYASTAYGELIVASGDPDQPYRILNPGKETIATTDSLGYVFDDPIQELFQTGSQNLALVSGFNQQTYTSARTTVTLDGFTYNVLQFTGPDPDNAGQMVQLNIFEPFFSTNAPTGSTLPPTASYYAGKPPAPSWLTNPNETAAQMVFGNDGVFGDANLQTYNGNTLSANQQSVLADLENQVVAALNRGIANLYNTTAQWQDSSNYYPTGQVSNSYAQFLHTQSISGTPVFIDGKAYAIAYDDQGGQNPTLVLVNQDTVSVTLGPWNTAAPAGTNANFVHDLYERVLGRPADESGYAHWLGRIEAGTPRSVVIESFLNSAEGRTRFVEDLYQTLLERPADPEGLRGYVLALQSGVSEDQIRASFFGSAEYFQKSGGTNQAFLEALFEDALDREISPSGLTAFLEAMEGGLTTNDVALSVLQSAEADQVEVEGFYDRFLNRQADPAGLAAWVALLQQGERDNAVRAGILNSQEFFL